MAASAEHEFLSACFNDVVREFSKLDVYTYGQVDRQLFDFSCTLKVTLERAVAGQTLWRHRTGVDKDVRSLLFDNDAEVKVYLVPADAKVQAQVGAVIDDFRKSGRFDDQLFRLVCLDYPVFDADDEAQRELVSGLLRAQVTENLLFRTVFGGLSARDLEFMFHVTNSNSNDVAFNLRLLHYVRNAEYFSYRNAAYDLRTNANKVRERRHILFGAGLVEPAGGGLVVTESGETFLRLLDRLGTEVRTGTLSPELRYLSERAGCAFDDITQSVDASSERSFRPMHLLSLALLFNDFNPDWPNGTQLASVLLNTPTVTSPTNETTY